MLEIRELFLKTGNFTLENISMAVKYPQCHIIIGPTGSGKTLLLESIIGFKRPQKGEILLDGKDITGLPVEKRNFAYVPQDLALFPHLTVEENIFYGLKVKNTKKNESKDLAIELVDTLKIRHLLKRTPGNLSGGERQRIALTRALAPGYKYLLLDEPLSALHEAMKKELWFLLKELQSKYNFAMLMVTHDMEEAFFLGDEISIMINGEIQQTGKKMEVYHYPQTIEVAKFFGIRNLFEGEVTGSDKDTIKLYCNDIEMSFSVHKTAVPQEMPVKLSSKLIVGIRPENIMIPRRDSAGYNQDNLLSGIITEIIHKGASCTALLTSHNSRRDIEIELPAYAMQKLDLSKGQEAEILFKKENLFLLKPTDL